MKFKVGDIITGKQEYNKRYFITNNFGKYGVVGINYEMNKIVIMVIDHMDKNNIGNLYEVEEQYFELVIGGAKLR